MGTSLNKIALEFFSMDRHSDLKKYAALFTGALGVIYLVWKLITDYSQDVDFKYFWFAGYLWDRGISAYGAEFVDQGRVVLDWVSGLPLFYPPNFWGLSVLYSKMDLPLAKEVWRWMNVFVILLGSVFLYKGFKATKYKISWQMMFGYTGLVCFFQATPVVIFVGQTSLVVYFGLTIFAYSILAKSNVWFVVGLVIVSLKPHVAIPLFAILFAFRIYQKQIIIAGLIVLLMALPALLPYGIIETLEQYLENLALHGTYFVNAPESTTGIRNLVHAIFNINISGLLVILIMLVMAFPIGIYLNAKGLLKSEDRLDEDKNLLLAICVSFAAFMAPLHYYDLTFITLMLLLSGNFMPIKRLLLCGFGLLLFRAMNLMEAITGLEKDPAAIYVNIVVSLSLLGIMLLCVMTLKRRIKTNSLDEKQEATI